MHRRKTSKEAAENGVHEERAPSAEPELDTVPPLQRDNVPPTSPAQGRTTPNGYPSYNGPRLPTSPSRNPPVVRAPSLGAPPSAPATRQTFAGLAPPPMNRHSRAPSVYEPLYGNPPSAPPTKSTFSPTSPTHPPISPWRTSFSPVTPLTGSSGSPPSSTLAQPPSGRRGHGRVHSRNLSVYFPRPGQAPGGGGVESIAEDADGQEIEYGNGHAAPIQLIPPPNANAQKAFGDGFKFGGLPMDANAPSVSEGGGKRRG